MAPDSDRVKKLEDERHEAVMGAIHGVHERLDTLNGRTRSLENKVSVLSWAYGLGAGALGVLYYKITGQPPQ